MTSTRSPLLAAVLLALSTAAFAQTPCPTAPVADHGKPMNGAPLASPPAVATATLGSTAITVNYNAPSMRCRKIFGGLLPFDKVWRTGANPATSFVTTGELKIGTITVPAGAYTLYTIPEQVPSSWILILNKQTGQWGTVYKPEMDLGRTEMKLDKLTVAQEVMSISFEHTTSTSTQLHVKWENTDAWITIKTAK